jgi:hypothetical protein
MLMGMVLASRLPALDAYSPYYLPGGKNYLCVDNFQYANGLLFSIDQFLIRPYTDYSLTIPRDYSEYGEGSEITIQFWTGDETMDTLVLDAGLDFVPVDGSINCYFATFKTGPQINMLSISFQDGRDPLSVNTILAMQLEEGTTSTAGVSIDEYIPGTVTDVNGPNFQGNPIVVSDVSQPLTLAQITAGITAYDDIDGNVSNSIVVVSDQYTGNGGILGNYAILFRAADAIGNTTEFTMSVLVVDVTDPVITGPGSVTIPFPQTQTVAELLSLLSASDNYDGNLTPNIVLKTDGYSALSSVIGAYEVVFEVSDASGNTSTYPLTVSVVDSGAPVISGISELVIGYDQKTTVGEIQNSLSAVDGYEGNVTSSITVVSDGFSGHLHQVGEYLIVFQASDAQGNTAQKTIIVKIIDNVGPILYFDSSVIKVYNSTILTLENFTSLLLRAGELSGKQPYKALVRFDSYSDNAAIPGTYHLVLDLEDAEGNIITKTFQIIVGESGSASTLPDLVPEQPSAWQENLSWIVGSGSWKPRGGQCGFPSDSEKKNSVIPTKARSIVSLFFAFSKMQ